jgi:hypothetical protein
MDAIAALDIPKAWLIAFWERELEPVIDEIVEQGKHSHYLLLADDTIPTQEALDLVLDALDLVLDALEDGRPVVTGYVNLDATAPHVNLTKTPFKIRDRSVGDDYDWYTKDEAASYPDALIPTHFAGSALTGMPLAMWRRFPFRCVTRVGEPRGYSSDWHLSIRLDDAGVPIVAPRGALFEHCKRDWRTQAIDDPEKRLLVGEIPSEVRWER